MRLKLIFPERTFSQAERDVEFSLVQSRLWTHRTRDLAADPENGFGSLSVKQVPPV